MAGGKQKKHLIPLIHEIINQEDFEIQIQFTENAKHTHLLSKRALDEGADIIIAVGGDGTVNNIAQHVAGTKCILGIIPMGSGNGLARELGISMDVKKALQIINSIKTKTIDTCMVNDNFFVNIAGVGFDAHVGKKFSENEKRGFKTYIKVVLQEFLKYKSSEYKISIDGNESIQNAFMICVCNGTQFGNNVYVSPNSNLDDGEFKIVIFEKTNLFKAASVGLKLFAKKMNTLSFIKTYEGQSISISQRKNNIVNVDGEAIEIKEELNFRIVPKNLKIIIP